MLPNESLAAAYSLKKNNTILLAFSLYSMSSLSETNQSTSVNSSASAHTLTDAIRNLTFNPGSDVDLTCSNKTWNEMMYVIWKIKLEYKNCKIGFSSTGQSTDTCSDGRSLRNTSRSQSYLHIPNFTTDDVGVYKCESAYNGGNENYVINMAIAVPPSISAWLEQRDKKMVAVCKAEGGKPAATVSWSHKGNSTSLETLLGSEGFITVESRLELTEDVNTENLACTIRHIYWDKERILIPKLKKGYIPWLVVPTVAVVCVFLVGLFFAQKKLIMWRRSQQSDTSQSKSPPTEDVDEVEPYASYIQRVNSIYN
ncbi:cell surface glycoprotein CD200 receptor 1 [Xiphias gladius]|uniref:cell surface glycoprotein CD200 receptor 1 n=1 Tax=Xiphias gladius TaxID=8245 RepID=UPI001A99EDCE|nr:cell surface glycoprotein CD200 receptor 1 [Xiphias gladius]